MPRDPLPLLTLFLPGRRRHGTRRRLARCELPQRRRPAGFSPSRRLKRRSAVLLLSHLLQTRTAAASAPAPGEPRGSPGPLLLPRSPPPRPAEPRRPRHPAGSYLGRVQGGQQGQQQEPGDAAGRPHPGAGAASPRLSPRLTPLPPRAPRLPPQPDWKRRRQRQPPGGRSFRGRARTALPVVPERLRCPAPARLRPAPARPSAKLRAREAVARMRHHGCRPSAARPPSGAPSRGSSCAEELVAAPSCNKALVKWVTALISFPYSAQVHDPSA